MAFARPTITEIYERIVADMESRLTGNVTLLRRALLRVLAAVFAGAVHILYGYLVFMGEQLFVDQAVRDWLNRHGFIWGVDRKAAEFAAGTFTFSGTPATNVPTDTRVARESDGVEYAVDTGGAVGGGGTVDLAATAIEAGVDGNMTDPTPVALLEPIAGITGVALNGDFTDGADEETDEDYRARILFRIQEPPAGGTAADYKRWAEEVAGVDKAWTYPNTPSPGQVTVAYLGTAAEATVETYIGDRMPVTTDLSVVKLTGSPYIIQMNFWMKLDPNTPEQQAAIEANLLEHFDAVAEPGGIMYRSQIDNAIASAGPVAFSIYAILPNNPPTIDAFTGDLIYTGFEYPTFNSAGFIDY